MVFIEQKLPWIEQALSKFATRPTASAIEMPYTTRTHSLQLEPCDAQRIKVRLTPCEIVVSYPIESHYTDPQVQSAIKKGIEQAWREEALHILPPLLDELARRCGFSYRSIGIRNAVSRWGSCSSRDDISLSLHLMRLPDHLIEYILLHELCHTVHKNHSPKFYALLDKVTSGRHAQLRRELKNFNTRW